MKTLLWRAINVVMAGLFLLSAAVQYNDPDPLLWMVIYVGAALLCLQTVAEKRWLPIAWAWGVGCLTLMVWLVSTHDVVASFDSEVFRELGGALIVSLWMLIVAAKEKLRPFGHAPKQTQE